MLKYLLRKAVEARFIPPFQAAGLRQALVTLVVIWLGLLVGAMTLPSRSLSAHAFRLVLFCFLLPKILDFATNKHQTFGHITYDTVFTMSACEMLFRVIDITFVSILRPSAPRWIRASTKELQRMQELRNEKSKDLVEGSGDLQARLPAEWITLPYPPPFSLARVLYAIDFLSLVRPGTSWLFPWQFRAFDWSLPYLKSPTSNRFGKPEVSGKAMVVHSLLWHLSILCCYVLFTRSAFEVRSITQFSLPSQILVTICFGCIVAFSNATCEALGFKFMLKSKLLPISALAPSFNRPYLATSIQDFWGKRWHQQIRRQLTRLGSLFPYGRTKAGNVFWAFVVSGMMHSFLFCRAYSEPTIWKPTTYLAILVDPGTGMFFGSQGVFMLIEKSLIPESYKQLWLWVSIISSGRWFVDSILEKGFFVI